MDERKNPPIWLMTLPLVGLAGLVAYQYIVGPTPGETETAAETATES